MATAPHPLVLGVNLEDATFVRDVLSSEGAEVSVRPAVIPGGSCGRDERLNSFDEGSLNVWLPVGKRLQGIIHAGSNPAWPSSSDGTKWRMVRQART